jgi:hypothetical protein
MHSGIKASLLRLLGLISLIGVYVAVISVNNSSDLAYLDKRSKQGDWKAKEFIDSLYGSLNDPLHVDRDQVSKTVVSAAAVKVVHFENVNNIDNPDRHVMVSESLRIKHRDNDDDVMPTKKLEIRPLHNLKSLKHNQQQMIDGPPHFSNIRLVSKVQPSVQKLEPPTTTGYVLAVNYYEQQSMGSRNLFQLQCWAQQLGLAVVKPVMKDSFLLSPLDQHQQQTLLKFEDSFDLKEWSLQTSISQFAPLVDWSEFLSNTPRNVILVSYNYPSVSVLKTRQKAGEAVLQDHIGERYKSGCSSKWPTPSQLSFLSSNGFHVVRTVCFNFYFGDQLTVDEFNAHLLGEYHASNVTIIMDMWRGLGTGQRVLIKDTCFTTYPINEHIKLSNRLLSDASRYVEANLGGQPFIAVMGRLEMTLLTVHKKDQPILPYCLKEIVSELDLLKKDTGLSATFLSIDIGRYGSKKWRTRVDPDLRRDFSNLIQDIYGPSASVSSWEKTFEDIAMTKDAGYIGLLQKAIVTKAKCVLFVGGGAFQRHALHLYRQLHPRREEQCLRVANSCTSSTKFRL